MIIDYGCSLINDQSMTPYEYKQALNNLRKRVDLLTYIESMIAVKGHAWCMDIKAERRKMARLFIDILRK